MLDSQNQLDIQDFDVIVFLKQEMRIMLDEELARAILLGDGRAIDDPDKIKEPLGLAEGKGIRSILSATVALFNVRTTFYVLFATRNK